MSFKRLRSRIQGNSSSSSFDQLANAFEADGQVQYQRSQPEILQPSSDYRDIIAQIKQTDAKLGRTFERLNSHQRHAVFHPTRCTLLSAMVGSGKTTVLIAKIFYLHFVQKVPFDQMVVLTFTNKAAREIKDRIAAFLELGGEKLNKQLRYFGTFHAVARQLLNEHPQLDELHFKAGFSILGEQEKQDFLNRIIAQENLNIKYQNQLAKRWRQYWESGQCRMGNMKTDDDFQRLVELAEQSKRQKNAMDFEDLLTLSNQLLKDHPIKAPAWIIVDEFQDCNDAQVTFIEQLKGADTGLFVVGDQNQSIYGWRGSKDHLFEQMYSSWDASWMELPQNYRSTGTILSAAETLLNEQNSALVATREQGTPIALLRHFDDQQEAYYLREQILSLQKEDFPLENMAILFRTHQQIKLVETVFEQAAVPFQVVNQRELHENPAQSFLLQVLKLGLNNNDVDACLAVVCDSNFGAFKRSSKFIAFLQDREESVSALQAARHFMELRKNTPVFHIGLLDQIETFKTEFLPLEEPTIDHLLDFLQLRPILKPTSIHHAEYLEQLTEAWNELCRYRKEKSWGDVVSIFQLAVGQVVLEGSFLINGRIKEAGRGVHLLTIHAAKGLEFDRVYIAGTNTGIIPLAQHHKGSQNVKEEKRLLFVAITRGKNRVEIGWHANPTMRNAEPKPSYFLNSIPEQLLERKELNQESPKDELEQADGWIVGQLISHKKYGEGTITAVDEKSLLCNFKSVGEKSFSTAFAQALLSKVDSPA